MWCLDNPNLLIFSGGTDAGKTTTLAELEKLGFACAPEVARHIIHEQVPKAMPQRIARNSSSGAVYEPSKAFHPSAAVYCVYSCGSITTHH